MDTSHAERESVPASTSIPARPASLVVDDDAAAPEAIDVAGGSFIGRPGRVARALSAAAVAPVRPAGRMRRADHDLAPVAAAVRRVQPASRVRRADRDVAPVAAALRRVQRLHHTVGDPVIRRELKAGQSGKRVKGPDGTIYLAHEVSAGKYSLQPVSGAAAIEVDVGTAGYDAVGDVVSAEEVKNEVDPATHPAAGYSVLEWAAKLRHLIGDNDWRAASILVDRMKAVAGGLPTMDTPALTDVELKSRFAKLPNGDKLKAAYADCLLAGSDALKARVMSMKKAFGAAITDEALQAIADAAAKELQAERRKPDMLPTLIRLIDQDKAVIDPKVPPTILDRPDLKLKAAYLAMTREKFVHDKVRTKYAAAIAKSGLTEEDGKARAVLLDHLEGSLVFATPPTYEAPEKETAEDKVLREKKIGVEKKRLEKETKDVADRLNLETVDQILARHIHKKASRLAALFDANPGLLDKLRPLVKDEDVHDSLTAIKTGGEQHSIMDINKYVGDKLNDPLMDWIIAHGIRVEVHATSFLASFAKMRSEGFVELIEVPSSHPGTKKYIAGNPVTGKAKVVFQTTPGASYAIQTVGAFYFYELYETGELKESLNVPSGPWKHGAYKARNVIKDDKERRIASFLLVGPDKSTLVADVPYVGKHPVIDDEGQIVLAGVPSSAIQVRDIKVKQLEANQLTVHKEVVDYKAMYLEIMRTNGITSAEIASIGQKKELKLVLESLGLTKPVLNVELPNFNASMYTLKKQPAPDAKAPAGNANLLLFSISPHFFGDRAGFLAQALKEIGVKHITFVGTAGGLAEGMKKGDTVVPEEVANVADVVPGDNVKIPAEGRSPNAAFAALADLSKPAELKPDEVKKGGLHVGVHSPITESQKMIDWMKRESVRSVDCEAGFIAKVLKDSDVKLYSIYYISDVPGTHESIGLGGVAAGDAGEAHAAADEKKEPNASERIVREIIKKVVGGKIEGADAAVPALKWISDDGCLLVSVAGASGKYDKKVLDVAVLQPSLVPKKDTLGVVRTFARSVAGMGDLVFHEERIVVTPELLNTLNAKADEFSTRHQVKLVLRLV